MSKVQALTEKEVALNLSVSAKNEMTKSLILEGFLKRRMLTEGNPQISALCSGVQKEITEKKKLIDYLNDKYGV